MRAETWEDFNHRSWESAVEEAKKRKDWQELKELLSDDEQESETKNKSYPCETCMENDCSFCQRGKRCTYVRGGE